jgi:hypothetical protein
LLLTDGTYTGSNSGYVDVNCLGGVRNGRLLSPITLGAEHERQAFVKGDGSVIPLQIQNCAYWQVLGLHLESGDFPGERDGKSEGAASVMYFSRDNHLEVRRNILAHNNRYFNSHLILGDRVMSSLFEENEFYYFHRHALNLSYGGFNTIRRNYFNSRLYPDIPGGRPSELCCQDRGDSAISLYPDHDSTIENNVGENNEDLMDVEAAFAEYASDNEKFYGNISVNDVYGVINTARGDSDAYTSHHSFYQDIVVIDPKAIGGYARSVGDFTCNRCTFIGNQESKGNFAADQNPVHPGGGAYSVHLKNSLAINATGKGAFGFYVNDTKGQWLWEMDHVNAYNNAANFVPPAPRGQYRGVTVRDPKLGACLVWLPDQSPMRGIGIDGSDIGASILFRYQDGALNETPLWNVQTGEFPRGAIVQGLNDLPGASAADVQKRLNVNQNGCDFPAAYRSGEKRAQRKQRNRRYASRHF